MGTVLVKMMALSIQLLLCLSSLTKGLNAYSSVAGFAHSTSYHTLGLFGEWATTSGLFVCKVWQMLRRDEWVAVAVRAMICTLSGRRLLTSLRWENLYLKPSPLHNIQTDKKVFQKVKAVRRVVDCQQLQTTIIYKF